MIVAVAPNQRWSVGFVSDQLSNGRRFRVLNLIDDYSREVIDQLVSFRYQVGKLLDSWIKNECLNQHWFRSLDDARKLVDAWRYQYNSVRPHSSLYCLTPVVFAEQAT